jgi:glycosyltransferase involved in cell wall biosynthesis
MDRLLDPATDYYFGVAFGQVPYLVNDLGLRGDKIRIIRNGVDPTAYTGPGAARRREVAESLGIAEGDRVVGILAVLRPEKDHATFLRAGRRVIDRMPQARLLVVGDGPCRADSERLADELGLGDRVIFAGMRSDIGDILSVVEVMALSSFTIECFPFSILEAMSAGIPAVCTAIGGLPELVEDGVTGHLVAPRDPGGLAEGILRVLEPEGRSAQMGAAARRRLEERFTLQRCVDETARTLTSIVAGPAR